MKNGLWAMVSVLLILGAACNSKKAEPESALDRAYRNGVLSKAEYVAKKAALAASAAPAAAPTLAAAPAPVVAPPTPAPSAVASAPTAATPAPPSEAPTAPVKAPPRKTPPAAIARPKSLPAEQAAAAVPTATVAESRPAAPPAVRPADPSPAEDAREPAPASACEDTQMRPGKEKGKQERFFPLPAARVKAAMATALKELDFNIHKATDTEIEAGKKRHIGLIGSGGERILLHFEDATEGGQRGTRVTGETKKGIVMRAGQKSWTNAVLDQAACTLGPARHTAQGHSGELR